MRTVVIEEQSTILALAENEAGIAAHAITGNHSDIVSDCMMNVLDVAAERQLSPEQLRAVITHFCGQLVAFFHVGVGDGYCDRYRKSAAASPVPMELLA